MSLGSLLGLSRTSPSIQLPPIQSQDDNRCTKFARRKRPDRRKVKCQNYNGEPRRETIDRRGIVSDRRP
jgi:hypothetical protein